MITVAACLWDANQHSPICSRCYDESWAEKLYRGFKRNLTLPFRFVVFTDRLRKFCDGIEQEMLQTAVPHFGCLIEPFRLDVSMIVCGLDMVVLKNVDHYARYCLEADKLAMPRHPSLPELMINPMVLAPAGQRKIFDGWRGENDMDTLRKQSSRAMDDLWPGEVLSLKLHDVRRKGTQGARVIYFHGSYKPHELTQIKWVAENWR